MLNFSSLPKFCISLKNSPRRKIVSQEFEKFDITNVNFFDAVDKNEIIVPELSDKLKIETDINISPGILACMMSHVKLITMAKNMGLKAIMVFEDDVQFCDDFADRIEYIEKNVEEFDMITLGGHFSKPYTKMIPEPEDAVKVKNTDYIYSLKRQGGTYAYIITDKVYDFIIRNCTYQYGMDQFYSDHVYHRFNCFTFVPFLITCAKGLSEITGTAWVYENIDWFYQQGRLLPKKTNKNIVEVKRKMILQPQITKAINLLDCTFITAVRIESPDREFNFMRVIQYLCDNFASTIIIKESAASSRVVELLTSIDRKECAIIHTFEQNDGAFHRTRLLNEALFACHTDVCVNYDIDVFMEPQAYVAARDKIVNEGWDLVFPFKQGGEIQKQVTVPVHIKNNYNGESLFNSDWITPWQSYVGHCQFFKTDSYISGGGENEEFISYGAEDRERMERFDRLGYKVMWGEACIYHIEHSRNQDSSPSNPHFSNNDALMWKSRNMSDDELVLYYRNMPYLKKYVK